MVTAIAEISLPTFTDPAGFTDALLGDELTDVQLSALGTIFETGGLTDLSSALGLFRDPQGGIRGVQDSPAQRAFKAAVYDLVRRDSARIQLLLAQARANPGTVRFSRNAQEVTPKLFVRKGSREARTAEEIIGAMDEDRKSLQVQNPEPSAVVAYTKSGKRLAIATSEAVLETKLARMTTRMGGEEYGSILIADIHGTAGWRRFDFGNHSSRYLDKVGKIRTEADRLSGKRFVGFWFNLWWRKAVQRIQDSRNILALNVLEAALVQYNSGRISYGTMVKVIKTLDIVIKQDPAADIRSVQVMDSFDYTDRIPDAHFPEKTTTMFIQWRSAQLPKGTYVFGIRQVPLTTP